MISLLGSKMITSFGTSIENPKAEKLIMVITNSDDHSNSQDILKLTHWWMKSSLLKVVGSNPGASKGFFLSKNQRLDVIGRSYCF